MDSCEEHEVAQNMPRRLLEQCGRDLLGLAGFSQGMAVGIIPMLVWVSQGGSAFLSLEVSQRTRASFLVISVPKNHF